MTTRLFSLLVALVAAILIGAFSNEHATRQPSRKPAIATSPTDSRLVDRSGLDNVYQVCPGIYSGSQPVGAAGFGSLADEGIKTVISVDGRIPDVDLAAQQQMAYVHLPIGYDEVEEQIALSMATAFESLEGPFYIHCHHGRHRGPAAAVVACIGLEKISKQQGLDFLKLAGTGTQYQGLYESVLRARKFSKAELESVQQAFCSIADTDPVVSCMVDLEKHFSALQQDASDRDESDHATAKTGAEHDSLMLVELFRELRRNDLLRSNARDKEYDRLLESSLNDAESLYLHYRNRGSRKPQSADRFNQLVGRIESNCQSCHEKFRN